MKFYKLKVTDVNYTHKIRNKMIGLDYRLRKVCQSYEQVENYDKAVADKENKWYFVHRKEITDKVTAQYLKDNDEYYDRTPEEMIFLLPGDYRRLMFTDIEKSEETRKKMSESKKGKKRSEYARQRIANGKIGLRRYNNGIINTYAKDAPEGFQPGFMKQKQDK